MDKLSKSWAFILWAGGGVLLALLMRPLFDVLWILVFGIWLIYVLLGAVLVGIGFFRAKRQRWKREALAHALATIAFGALLFFAFPLLAHAGDFVTFKLRFLRIVQKYEIIVAEFEQGTRPPKRGTAHGVQFYVDEGPPLRVAFLHPGGITDNWEGVVYDPSGVVGLATGWRNGVPGSFSAPPEVVDLFGGDLVGCESVRKHFYRCWFT